MKFRIFLTFLIIPLISAVYKNLLYCAKHGSVIHSIIWHKEEECRIKFTSSRDVAKIINQIIWRIWYQQVHQTNKVMQENCI